MSKETKVVIVLLAIYLFWHWRNLQTALATGGTGAAGNATPGYTSVGGTSMSSGPGNAPRGTTMRAFPETWGSFGGEYE
jgi:hypothetical protein